MERRPRRRLTFVEIRVEVRADRHEEVDARAYGGHERGRDQEARTGEGARIGRQDVGEHGGSRQHAHQVVRRREREQVDDEHQVAVAPRIRRLVRPPDHEPEDEGNRQHAHRVDLFVHDRLVPHGERRGADQGARGRGRAACPAG